MTEKRFTRIVCSNDEYTGSLYCNDEPLKIDEVCKLLNELHEEKTKLKTDLKFETRINNGKRFENDGRILIDNETKLHYICTLDWEVSLVTRLLNTLHEENQSYKQKVHETLQKYMDEYMNKEHTDLDPMVYASEVIDEIAEELGVELE